LSIIPAKWRKPGKGNALQGIGQFAPFGIWQLGNVPLFPSFDPACRASYHYRNKRPDQSVLRKRIREIAETRACCGYHRIHTILRREGWHVNVNCIRRH
jgi:hypothetical protein